MSQITKGTWEAVYYDDPYYPHFDEPYYPHFIIGTKEPEGWFNVHAYALWEADACLIAAAPEMYKFIQTLYELITNPEEDEEGLSFRFVPEAAKQILDRINVKESEAR